MKSMTGFGSADFSTASGVEIHIDITSYNKKQLDIRVSLPDELLEREIPLKKKVAELLFRGFVNLKIEISYGGTLLDSSYELNRELASAYIKSAAKLQKNLEIAGEININEVLKLPGIIKKVKCENLISDKDLNKVLEMALCKLLEMRKKEGAELKKDIKSRLKTVETLLEKIRPFTVEIPEIQKKRLLNNMKIAGLDIKADDERVLKEIVIFTDRSDVSEEITRIQSHFMQFGALIDQAAPAGRNMEFMIQELQREINTLGAKATHIRISPLVVKFKTELEKIREQIQNVE